MRDPWTEKISEYLDGALEAADQRAIEAHIAACDVCGDILRDLRDIRTLAGTLTDAEPATDLWPGIAARLAPGSAGGIVPIGRRSVPRLHVSVAHLAAVAVVIMTVSGGAVWLLGRGPATEMVAGTIMHTAGGPAAVQLASAEPVEPVEPDPEYDRAVAELQQVLAENRSTLDPATVEVIERSILSIDHAIEDALEALADDPGNPHLHRQLDSTRRRKVDLLRLATRGAS